MCSYGGWSKRDRLGVLEWACNEMKAADISLHGLRKRDRDRDSWGQNFLMREELLTGSDVEGAFVLRGHELSDERRLAHTGCTQQSHPEVRGGTARPSSTDPAALLRGNAQCSKPLLALLRGSWPRGHERVRGPPLEGVAVVDQTLGGQLERPAKHRMNQCSIKITKKLCRNNQLSDSVSRSLKRLITWRQRSINKDKDKNEVTIYR